MPSGTSGFHMTSTWRRIATRRMGQSISHVMYSWAIEGVVPEKTTCCCVKWRANRRAQRSHVLIHMTWWILIRFMPSTREIRVNAFTPDDSVVKLSTWNIGYRASRISLYPHQISSYSCSRTVHPMVNCGVSRWKWIRVNAALLSRLNYYY